MSITITPDKDTFEAWAPPKMEMNTRVFGYLD